MAEACILLTELPMDTSFCIDAFEEAIDCYGKPEIFNTDQGSQYTSDDFISVLKGNEIKSAWMVKVHGVTMFLLSVFGVV